MSEQHRVIVQHDQTHCWAWCATCYWRGPRVKYTKTAQGWAEKHSPTHQGKHRTTTA